jgi:signal transduction histidine kinase
LVPLLGGIGYAVSVPERCLLCAAIQGSGLGLAISQAIAQAHGGLIEVTSEENAGTTFRLVFPANT